MPTNLEKLGSFDDFQFASVVNAEEIDRDKLKKYVFGLLTDKAKAQDARDAAKSETADVQAQLDEATANLSGKGDLAAKLVKAEKERDEAKAALAERDRKDLAADVAEEKGLSRAQAKYLQGATKEELEASADEFIKDNGIQVKDPEDDQEDDDDEAPSLRRTPRSTVNPSDPKVGDGSPGEIDFEKVVAGFETNPFR